MPLNLEQKKAIVEEVSNVAKSAVSGLIAENTGLTVSEMTTLRSQARKAGIYLKVVRNNLAKRAFDGSNFEGLKDNLVGPVLLAFSMNEPAAPAKLVKEFIKNNDKLKVKRIAIGSNLYQAGDLEKVASLPSRDEAISMLMGTMQAPIAKFVRTTIEPIAKFVRTTAAVADEKQKA